MANIVARIKASNKDGTDITFVDYKGERQTKRYAPVATFFRNENGKISIKFEKGFKASDDCWYNLYVEDGQQLSGSAPRNERRGQGDDKVPF